MSIGHTFSVQGSMDPYLSLAHTVNQTHKDFEGRSPIIDPSNSGNRLIENLNGTIGIVPKSPAEVFGEKVFRPLIDHTVSFGEKMITFLKNGGSYFDQTFTKMAQILPGASASVFARSHYFGKGDGYIRVIGRGGKIILGPGIKKEDLLCFKGSGFLDAYNLYIRFGFDSSDVIVVENFFDRYNQIAQPQKIETLVFPDGQIVNLSQCI